MEILQKTYDSENIELQEKYEVLQKKLGQQVMCLCKTETETKDKVQKKFYMMA